MSTTRPVQLHRFETNAWGVANDELAAEEPLEIRVEGHSLAVVMRTPGHDRELAAGFLFTEGLIRSKKDVFDITTCVPSGTAKGNAVDVGLAKPSAFDLARFTRHVFTSASCGVCSKSTIEEVLKRSDPLPSRSWDLSAELLLGLPGRLSDHQEAFRRTGGLHACALFTSTGELEQVREDVGRHNALDKLIGWAFREGRLPLSNHLLLLSGRTSFEMMQKAQAAGIPVVAAISAPTSLAVEMAQAAGQTLIGFLRGGTMNLYAGTMERA